MSDPQELEWRPPFVVDIALTVSALGVGRSDPCHRVGADGSIWRTGWFAGGGATLRIARRDGAVRATAWGPGAADALDSVPRLLGAGDDPSTFEPRIPVLAAAWRRLPGLRIPATGRLFDPLVQAVLHQKVNGRDAVRAWCTLVRRHGSPAPGPSSPGPSSPGPSSPGPSSLVAGMRLPPTPAQWLAVPVWDWRRAGVEPSAANTVRLVASRASALERVAGRSTPDVYRALLSIPGVGPWTAAETGHRALGDADALPVGDYHLAAVTSHVLAGGQAVAEGEAEGWWEGWRPHRYRAWRLLELTLSAWPPRRGPRMSRPEHRYGY